MWRVGVVLCCACTNTRYYDVPRSPTPEPYRLSTDECIDRCRAKSNGDRDYASCLQRCGMQPDETCTENSVRQCVRSEEFTTGTKIVAVSVGLAIFSLMVYGIYGVAKDCSLGSFFAIEC